MKLSGGLLRPLPALMALALVQAAVPGAARAASDWPAYLDGPLHRSAGPASVITPSTAATLTTAWQWRPAAASGSQPAAGLYASPTVSGGRVFIGANTGVFYALSEATGTVLWSRDLGHLRALTCHGRGITSTATVAGDVAPTRLGLDTVYVAGGDGYLYALDAATGNVVWRQLVSPPGTTQNTYYNWSSPTLAAGHVYLGLSSECDNPLVRAGVVEVDQATGAILHTYWTVPTGAVGGSVWTSVAATLDGSAVFATTGNGDPTAGAPQGDSFSIVRLDGRTMTRQGRWTVPPLQRVGDGDFGASPTLYSAAVRGTPTRLVAACNKNGVLYALRAGDLAAGPLWKRRLQTAPGGCLAAAAVRGNALFAASGQTTIGIASALGSVRKLDAATGALVWQQAIGAAVAGSPSVDAGGVVAVPTMDGTAGAANGVYLLDAVSGAVIRRLTIVKEFAQPVFADGYLFTAAIGGGLRAWSG